MDITYKLLKCIDDDDGETNRWDLTKIVGSPSQFRSYVGANLVETGFVSERKEGRHYFYSLTKIGKEFYSLLKKDYLLKAVLRISGKRLKREDL